jgi:hypothetical protein
MNAVKTFHQCVISELIADPSARIDNSKWAAKRTVRRKEWDLDETKRLEEL